jgi:hypothetical protein
MNARGTEVKEALVLKLPPQHFAEIGHLSLLLRITGERDGRDDDGDWLEGRVPDLATFYPSPAFAVGVSHRVVHLED